MTSFKEREKRRREQEILTEAGRIIREKGFAGLNLDDLADAVGISKPTLYQHFKSKDDLIARVLVHGLDELREHMHTTTDVPPLERLTMALRMLLKNRYASDGVLAVINPELLVATIHTHPEFLAHKQDALDDVYAVIDEGKTRGEIIEQMPTPLIGTFLFMCLGLPHTFRHHTQHFNVEEAIEYTIQLFIRAIRA